MVYESPRVREGVLGMDLSWIPKVLFLPQRDMASTLLHWVAGLLGGREGVLAAAQPRNAPLGGSLPRGLSSGARLSPKCQC